MRVHQTSKNARLPATLAWPDKIDAKGMRCDQTCPMRRERSPDLCVRQPGYRAGEPLHSSRGGLRCCNPRCTSSWELGAVKPPFAHMSYCRLCSRGCHMQVWVMALHVRHGCAQRIFSASCLCDQATGSRYASANLRNCPWRFRPSGA